MNIEQVKKDKPVSIEAKNYADKLFPCEKPCDSYGVCEGCLDRIVFLAGYNFGYRALSTQHAQLLSEIESLFDKIKHGDSEHQTWLKKAIAEHFSQGAGEKVPSEERHDDICIHGTLREYPCAACRGFL